MLPNFPEINERITEEQLERIIEKLIDAADKLLMNNSVNQEEYNEWFKQLRKWENSLYDRRHYYFKNEGLK